MYLLCTFLSILFTGNAFDTCNVFNAFNTFNAFNACIAFNTHTGLPSPLEVYKDLDGRVLNLSHALNGGERARERVEAAAGAGAEDFIALSQITRCYNCTKAYLGAYHNR